LRPASDWDLYGGKLLARGIGSASIDPVERNVLAAVVAPLYILPGAEDSLIREARVYAQLEHLQGRHVARCYGLWRREYRAVLSPSGNDPNASRCDEEVYIIVTDDLGPSIAEEFGGYFWPEANEKYG
jgi:hypothetical protein